MPHRDPKVDEYIENAAGFAKPILAHLRETVHEACPDVEEAMKWRFPHFMYKGMLCSMAAFKQHAVFGFWKSALVLGDAAKADEAMGHFGRIAALPDLPPKKTLIAYIRKAAALNEAGVQAPRAAARPRKPLRVPADLSAALKKNAKARAAFGAFPPSHKREYVEWITGAKKAGTRTRRVTRAIAQIAEGKPQNWKYEPAAKRSAPKR